MAQPESEEGGDVALVIPARDAAEHLGEVLAAARAAGFDPAATVLVDDGSRDGTAAIARRAGVRVISRAVSEGPATARNRGVAASAGAIIVFVDADVVMAPDVRRRMLAAFAAEPGLGAIFGAYDAAPRDAGLVSRYRNLLHHHVHHAAAGEVASFWTGLGAVRRRAFEAAGGFDPAWTGVEDVEFGARLAAGGGRIRLDPEIRGTHLKRWSWAGMWRTDLRLRAIPWSRLLLAGRVPRAGLNLGLSHRLGVAGVGLALAGLALAPVDSRALWLAGAGAALYLTASARLLAYLLRVAGPAVAAVAVPAHAVHYLAGGLGFARVLLAEHLPSRIARR
ncbi:hypothetical protein LNKW23_38500 [Paralimibaculum aggregatum]|uniref:Glycosyltransferase 2-like domain-containing protein n=1 Tax=Paralimibaculum aggregatum TaxID=3036245 RepID=A0ABQ6LN32_9RHOB|nr:glycosyltransferase family A protein [Limibaculum sp. NKW23]GMG84634.1 hypothetical protein LNKW23_38500 [Limibaculum sp. NKW23]